MIICRCDLADAPCSETGALSPGGMKCTSGGGGKTWRLGRVDHRRKKKRRRTTTTTMATSHEHDDEDEDEGVVDAAEEEEGREGDVFLRRGRNK